MFQAERSRRPRELPELRPGVGRVPPQDLDAEAAVLSACLLSGEAIDQVQEFLAPEHFYSDANRKIFEAIVALQVPGSLRPVDIVSVAGWLKDRERLQQIGGTPYLAQLTDATPAVAHVVAHARTVREKWRVRQLIATCQKFAAEGYGDYGECHEFIDGAEQAIFEIARVPETSAVQPVKEAVNRTFAVMQEAFKRGGGITGVPTGFGRLDRLCAGLHKGDLYIVAGRPGMGKTSFVLNIAINVASPRVATRRGILETDEEIPGYGVGFFSLEMPSEQLAARLLSVEARVSASNMRKGTLSPDEWNRLTDAAARVNRLPIWLDDTPALGLLELRAKIRRLKADLERGSGERSESQGLGLVVVDYLQLMHGRKDANSREQEISELSRGLKQLAKEMQVPVIALSQLNRSVETRTSSDKRPQLSDLRESGAIEQDADMVLFIYREEMYNRDTEKAGIAEIIISKQRNGPTGTVEVRFSREYTRFDNLAEDGEDFDQYDDFDPAG